MDLIKNYSRNWHSLLSFAFCAVMIGGISALFAYTSNYADRYFHRIIHYSLYYSLIITPSGLFIIAYALRNYFPEVSGSGIPQAIASLNTKDVNFCGCLLSWRSAISKFFLTIGGFFAGASIGREGPTVQISAAIMHFLWRRGLAIDLNSGNIANGLILSGSAAGISAAFNTPIAGIVFAIEELSRSFDQNLSGTILTAVILSGLVAMGILGDYTYFGISNSFFELSFYSIFAIIVCGLIGGIFGGLFSKLLLILTKYLQFQQAKNYYIFVIFCGLLLSLLGIISSGDTFGSGYNEAKAILTSQQIQSVVWFYPVTKFLATLISYISGIPGGIFAPSLSIGAGLGKLVTYFMSYNIHMVIVLVMVGYFCGVIQSPITSVVIVNEMLDDHSMVFPVFLSAFIAYLAAKTINKTPLYESLAQRILVERE